MSVARVTTAFLSALGGIAILVYAALQMLATPGPPLPEGLALGIAGMVEIALGIGLYRRRRLAWAFALSLDGTGLLILLLAAPRLARAGASVPTALLPAACALLLLGLLVASRDDFK
jgi:hypothetical protein